MKTKLILLFSIFFLFTGVNRSYAVNLKAGDWQFGINGFLDGEYTTMDEMPMVMPSGMLGQMAKRSFFDQHHMNLLFGAEKGKARVNINLKSHHRFFAEDGESKGELELEEVYGVYSFHDLLKLQVGAMLAPFGIYNSVRYITPLFATVVLPQMYEMPGNYKSGSTGGSTDESVGKSIMPDHANLMIQGSYSGDNMDLDYNLYLSNGERGEDGVDLDRNKGFGLRLRTAIMEDYKFGFSYYTVKNDGAGVGTEKLMGFDAEIDFLEVLKLEAEYVNDKFDVREDRSSYYIRLTGQLNKFSPFFAYDYVKDKANNIYKRGQMRYGVGSGYRLSDTVTVKAEYHLHKLPDKDMAPALPDGTDTISMFRGSMIFVF